MKKNQSYDYIIVGSGLTGLIIANVLSQIGSSRVLLLEKNDLFGGFQRSILNGLGVQTNGLRYLPSNEFSYQMLNFLETILKRPIGLTSQEIPPVCFESGQVKPFLGFGETSPLFYEEVSYFLSTHRLKSDLKTYDWIQLLFNEFKGEVQFRSYVTKILTGADKDQISLIINGQKQVQAQQVIYTGPIRDLPLLLPENTLNTKARQKIAKSSSLTAICLDLLHSSVNTEREAIHLFQDSIGSNSQDDLQAAYWGLFHPSQNHPVSGNSVQFSQWMGLISIEGDSDNEKIGLFLKKMKRLLRKAYPESLDSVLFERVLIVPDYAVNRDLKLNFDLSLPTLPHLHIATASLSSEKNVLGALKQAEIVLQSLNTEGALYAYAQKHPPKPI